MDLAELLRESLRAIRTHALRSFLTLLGIVIGVATLVGVISVISGLNLFVRDKLFGLAPDVFVVSKFGIIRSREELLDDEAYRERNGVANPNAELIRELTAAGVLWKGGTGDRRHAPAGDRRARDLPAALLRHGRPAEHDGAHALRRPGRHVLQSPPWTCVQPPQTRTVGSGALDMRHETRRYWTLPF